MARPSSSADNLKKHATKAELAQRKEAEKAAMTGMAIRESKEVAKDRVAHAEFLRVSEILTAVGKNDAMFEAVINDYCVYKSDIARYQAMRKKLQKGEMDVETQYKLVSDCDKRIDAYRKKRFDIEKECGFTLASAMRAIPKKAETAQNPLLEVLGNGSGD